MTHWFMTWLRCVWRSVARIDALTWLNGVRFDGFVGASAWMMW